MIEARFIESGIHFAAATQLKTGIEQGLGHETFPATLSARISEDGSGAEKG
jgi:hypothetical protein